MKQMSHVGCNCVVMLLGMTMLLCSGGCSSRSTNPVGATASANEDIAQSVASSLARNNGGVADQIRDLSALTHTSGLVLSARVLVEDGCTAGSPTYDPQTGTWEWGFSHEFLSGNAQYYALVTRTYQWRFKKGSGQPQIAYVVGRDTAYSIELTVVHGDGRHRTPRLSQALTSLTGSFVATGTNTDVVTVNGSCSRGAVDTISTHNALRSLDHHTSLTLANIQFQRNATTDPWESISGTITGTFTANITFASGSAYDERTVNRDISVTLGQGEAVIHIGGRFWTADLLHGEFQ